MTAPDALAGRTAVVTGASHGIGILIAERLVAAGARTIVVARDTPDLASAARSLGSLASPVAADMGDRDDVVRLIGRVQAESMGAPDILVLNAGMFVIAPVGTLSVERFNEILQVNLVGHYQLLNEFVPRMRERGSGDIVTVGSIADHTAFEGNAAYSASKFGARGMHGVLRRELKGSGVRVSLVSPGPVDTPIWDGIDPSQRPARRLDPGAVADAVLFIVTRPLDVDIEEIRLEKS